MNNKDYMREYMRSYRIKPRPVIRKEKICKKCGAKFYVEGKAIGTAKYCLDCKTERIKEKEAKSLHKLLLKKDKKL
jgi:predicted Zn-ribbon and HTH transcriptional regulator